VGGGQLQKKQPEIANMPLGKNVRYRVKQTSKGPVRLAFRGSTIIEAVNLKTKKTHTPEEFKQDRLRQKAKAKKGLGRRY
jgi:hypothetical protein